MATLKTDKAKQLWESSSEVSRLKWLNENKFKKEFAKVNFEKLHENVSKKLVELSKTKTKLYEADQTEIVNAYNKSIEGNLDRAGAISAVARDMNIDVQEVEDALTAAGINEAENKIEKGAKFTRRSGQDDESEVEIIDVEGDTIKYKETYKNGTPSSDGSIGADKFMGYINEDDAEGVVNTGELSASIWDSSDEATREAWLTKNGLDVELKTKSYAELPDEATSKMSTEVTTQVDNLGEGLIADAIKKSVAKNFGINPEGEITSGSTKSKKLPTFEKFSEGIVMDQAKKTNANTSKIPAAGEVTDGDTKSLPKMYEAHRAWKNFDAKKKENWLNEKKFDKTFAAKHFGKLPKNVMESFIADMADKSASKNFGIPVSGKVEKGDNKKATLPVMEGTTKGRLNEWSQNFGIPVNGKVERLAQNLPSINTYIAERKKRIVEASMMNKVRLNKFNAIANKESQTIAYDTTENRDKEFETLLKKYNDQIVAKSGAKAIKFNQTAAWKDVMGSYGVAAGAKADVGDKPDGVSECEINKTYTYTDEKGNVYNATCTKSEANNYEFKIDSVVKGDTEPKAEGDTVTLDDQQADIMITEPTVNEDDNAKVGEQYVHEDINGNVYNVTCKTISGDKGTFVVDEILETGNKDTAKKGDVLTLDKAQIADMMAANVMENETDYSKMSDEELENKFNELTSSPEAQKENEAEIAKISAELEKRGAGE